MDEKEAAVVRLIFELYSSPEYRFGCKRIAQHLNAHGYKTRNGLAWLSAYVIKIINNPVYAGFTTYDEASYENRTPSKAPRYKQKLFTGEHPALIDAELWERVQAIKATENTVKRVKRSHEFSVKVVSQTEFVLSLALPANDLVAEEVQQEAAGDRRLMTVVASTPGPRAPRGSEVIGSPHPVSTTRVTSGAAPTRVGGPAVPNPRLT
jgi:hypothetical protein